MYAEPGRGNVTTSDTFARRPQRCPFPFTSSIALKRAKTTRFLISPSRTPDLFNFIPAKFGLETTTFSDSSALEGGRRREREKGGGSFLRLD